VCELSVCQNVGVSLCQRRSTRVSVSVSMYVHVSMSLCQHMSTCVSVSVSVYVYVCVSLTPSGHSAERLLQNNTHIHCDTLFITMCVNYRAFWQNIVSFIGLYCKRDLQLLTCTRTHNNTHTNVALSF